MSKKTKLKWCREGVDNYEDMALIPVSVDGVDDKGFNDDGDLAVDKSVAYIKIGYCQVRFYNGRGGQGTSRPDAYVAYVKDVRAKHGERLLVEGTNTQVKIGGIFSDKYTSAFTSLRAAKKAVDAELKLLAQIGAAPHGGAWQSTDELPNELCMDEPSPCNACGGELTPLGTLGTVNHFRCRNCGIDSHAS